ncbi:MAG: CBS domain-containing protein [Promethearchaeota archaeon]
MEKDSLKYFGEIKVSEIMIKNPLYINPGEKISKTELLMLRKKIGGLPVVDKTRGNLIGIITQRDIRLARFAMTLDTTVKDLMTPEPFVTKESTSLKEALEIMFKNKIERLPVVNDKNELIGLVLQQEILKKLLMFL